MTETSTRPERIGLAGTWVTVAEAAAVYGVWPQSLRRAIRAGRLPARRVGAKIYLIEASDLLSYRPSPRVRSRARRP